jgi:hypothetical protein
VLELAICFINEVRSLLISLHFAAATATFAAGVDYFFSADWNVRSQTPIECPYQPPAPRNDSELLD